MFIATPLPLCSTPTLYPTMGSWLLQTALTEAFPMHIGSMYTHTHAIATLHVLYIYVEQCPSKTELGHTETEIPNLQHDFKNINRMFF